MHSHAPIRKRMLICFGPAVILVGVVPSASAQISTYSSTTETHDATWNRSTRVNQTRVEANGRRIETKVIEKPSVNGGYAVETATEKETIHNTPNNFRVVERWYAPDANGRRQLARIMEAETTIVPGGNTTTVRTRYDSDLDGHLQAMEREIQESVWLNASTSQTTSTLFLLRGDVFVPVQRTVTLENRKESGVIDVQRTVSFPEVNGKFITAQVTHTIEEQSPDRGKRTKEERVIQADSGMVPGEGQISPIQRTVTRQWTDSEGQEHSVAETYSMFFPGIAPDDELHMNRQVATVRQVMPDGATKVVEETADINPGAKTDPPKPRAKMIEITQTGPDGQFQIQTTFEAPNSSGAMQPFYISKTRDTKRGSD